MSRLFDQIKQSLAAFSVCGTTPALIGGLALAAHQVVRATQDIDFLADLADANSLDEALSGLGYQCIHRSENAANYRRGDEALDLLFAHRPHARRLLAQAQSRQTPFGPVRVVSAEGLIGLKLQAYVNDPRRSRDLDDIRNLLSANRGGIDLIEVRTYFELFDHSDLLERLLAEGPAT